MNAIRPSARAAAAFPVPPAAEAPIRDWALWGAAIGRITGLIKIFPCWEGEKTPMHKGWQAEASNDRLTVECMFPEGCKHNIGWAIQGGGLCLDLDEYKPAAKAAIDAFVAEHGPFPDTLENASARGGFHLIYRADRVFGNGTGSLPGIGDVRGHGGYIIGPGSYFEGSRYLPDNVAQPVALPAHVSSRLIERKRNDPKGRELPQFVSLDDPQNVDRFVAWLRATARPSISGQGGNNDLAAAAAMGSSFGLSWGVVLACLAEHFNPRCEPPWDDADLEKHGGSGYRSASSQFGNMARRDPNLIFTARQAGEVVPLADEYGDLEQYFRGVLTGSRKRELRGKRWRDVAGDPPPKFVIYPWRTEGGVASPYGDSMAGKTYVVIYRLLCVATGRPYAARAGFEGYWIGAPRPVVIFAGEDAPGVKQRIRAAIQGGNFTAVERALIEENLIFIDTVYSLNTADGLAAMAEEVDALGVRPALIAVDTLNLALQGNEDSSEENKKATAGFRALCVMVGAAGEVIDHVGLKDSGRARGSSAKKANQDATELVTRNGDVIRVEAVKLRGAAIAGVVVAFRSHEIALTNPTTGEALLHPQTGKPITDLWLEPIDPDTTRSLFQDQTPKAKRERKESEEKANAYFVSWQALLRMMEGFVGKVWSSDISLARDLSTFMAGKGSTMEVSTLQRHLSKHRAAGFPYCDGNRWVCVSPVPKHEPAVAEALARRSRPG